MGCYICYSEEGPGRAEAPPSPLLAVPNVTAHPSTASAPITVLLYDGPLLCGFNVTIKGLIYFYLVTSLFTYLHHAVNVAAMLCQFQKDCPSGQLTRAKFLEVYSSFFPQGNAEKFCEHVFRTFDADNSGRIDFKEFLLAINITSTGKPEQKLEWAFQMYDVNGDGTIEPSEMAEIIGVRSAFDFVCMSVCPSRSVCLSVCFAHSNVGGGRAYFFVDWHS